MKLTPPKGIDLPKHLDTMNKRSDLNDEEIKQFNKELLEFLKSLPVTKKC